MEIWRKCKETDKTFSTNRAFLNHLRTLKMTSKEYYDKHHRMPEEGYCKNCGGDTKYHGYSYRTFCSVICSNQDEDFRYLMSSKFDRNPDALESFRKIRKEKKWGSGIEKRKQTIEKKAMSLGITVEEYYSNRSRKAYNSQTEEQKRNRVIKRMETIESSTGNYGGRSGYKKVPFFGETVSLQGYEPYVLEYLIENGMTKDMIKVGKSSIPIIKYINREGKKSLFFPDFYLPMSNLIIEVKSEYTYNQHKENNLLKAQATIKAGYSIIMLIISKSEARKGKLEGSKKILDWAISSQDPNPKWYGEGSTTIRKGVESSDSKCSPTYEG